MQELLIYLLKSSGLLTVFFLAYYFLLSKETFFKSNRWFLITGLMTSSVLPLFFIEKIVLVEAPKLALNSIAANFSNVDRNSERIAPTFEIDWFQIGIYVYGIITLLLLFKIIYNLISLYKVLSNRQIIKKEQFQYIDVTENLSPFSFFNYIVYNSSLYTESELQSILLHEKIHSAQKHSLDVLLTNLFAVIFWFNPFMYLYKKAVIQNLEYIADAEAIAQINDKKSYQMALLKVVSNQNCLPITNHFYQSLIKKRIVMLNKNQSHKRNSWKYAVIIPALVAFVILFQVKVIAQEKLITLENGDKITPSTKEVVEMNWNKNSPDSEFANDASEAKKIGLNLVFSDIKRNSKDEITNITISFQDNLGNKSFKTFTNKDGIDPIYFRRSFDQNKKGEIGVTTKNSDEKSDSKKFIEEFEKSYSISSNETLVEKDYLLIINGKEYFRNDMKNFNFSCDGSITQLDSEEAIKRFGTKGKDGALIFNGKTTITDATVDNNFPIPPTPPTPPSPPEIAINTEGPFLKFPPTPKAPNGSPLTNKKEWDKFDKKMEQYEKKMEAIQPQIDAYAEKMTNVDQQMKPFEKEMEAFEKKMELFEKEMEDYNKKVEAYQKLKQKK